MKKENWNISYARLAYEHKWGGVITSFLSLSGFCYVINQMSESWLGAVLVPGSFNQQALFIALVVAMHSLMVPKLVDKGNQLKP